MKQLSNLSVRVVDAIDLDLQEMIDTKNKYMLLSEKIIETFNNGQINELLKNDILNEYHKIIDKKNAELSDLIFNANLEFQAIMNDNKLLEIKEMLNSLGEYVKTSELDEINFKLNNEFDNLKTTLNNNNIFIEEFKLFKNSLINTLNETSKDIILLQTKINTTDNSEFKSQYENLKEELNNKNSEVKKEYNNLKEELSNNTSEVKKEYNNLKEELNNVSLLYKEAIKTNEELKNKYEKLKEESSNSNSLLNKDLYETKNRISEYREDFRSELQKAKQEITTEVVSSIKEFIKQNLK